MPNASAQYDDQGTWFYLDRGHDHCGDRGHSGSVAVPSYMSSVRDSRRADAKQAMLAAAQTMESFYAMNMTYVGSSTGTTPTIFATKVPKDGSDRYYTLSFTAAPTASTYTLQAVPQGSQADDRCGTLSLTRAGVRSASKNDCW